jgi:hypothetical protein
VLDFADLLIEEIQLEHALLDQGANLRLGDGGDEVKVRVRTWRWFGVERERNEKGGRVSRGPPG